MWTLKKKEKVEPSKPETTYSANGSKLKIYTKSGNSYEMSTDQNMRETLEAFTDKTLDYIYDDNGFAIKTSEIEAFYHIVGGQDNEQSETV